MGSQSLLSLGVYRLLVAGHGAEFPKLVSQSDFVKYLRANLVRLPSCPFHYRMLNGRIYHAG